MNEEITSRTILLIGAEGEKMGPVSLDDALAMAEEKGFDLVEVNPMVDHYGQTCLLAGPEVQRAAGAFVRRG